MSRLGKTPISIPKGVELKSLKGEIEIKGPKGTVKQYVPEGISLKIEEEMVTVEVREDFEMTKAEHGLYRSLINNAIIGVSAGFEKQLSLIGVGYRAAVKGDMLDLQLGFSHPCQVAIPKELTVAVDKSTLIKVNGIDKQAVGQFAAIVRAVRPPEPYKGKGIRYINEFVRKKAGKAAKGK